MTPLEEHTALVAAVTEMLRVAEAAEARFFVVANLSNAMGSEGNPVTYFSATHGPAWAAAAHREALERLNRHRPTPHVTDPLRSEVDPWDLSDCGECSVRWPECPEVAGLRSVYMKGEQT